MKKLEEYLRERELKLETYLKEKEAETKKQNSQLNFLRTIKNKGIPLEITEHSDRIEFSCRDYTLATNIEINRRGGSHPYLGGFNCYDGGYDYSLYEWYPQFSFNIKLGKKKERVYIRHEGFEEDEKVIIKSVEYCHGWGDYTGHTKQTDQRIDPEVAYKFFRKQGVKKELIKEVKIKLKAGEALWSA